MTTPEDLQKLAAQLSRPTGEKGLEIADMMHAGNIAMTRQAIARLELKNEESVLELGHGNGGHLEELLTQAAGLSYHGLEISELMQAEAQTKNQDLATRGQVHFHLYNGLKIPFPDRRFDKILTVNTLYFWQDPPGLLNELYRVLRPGGRLCISYGQRKFMEQLPFTQYGFTLYDPESVAQLFAQTPFPKPQSDTHSDPVVSKTGDTVQRTFTTVWVDK